MTSVGAPSPLESQTPEPLTERTGGRSAVLRALRADRWTTACAAVVVVYLVVALAAPLIAATTGQTPYRYHLGALDGNGAPRGFGGGISGAHWFGVEPLTGRDLFAIVVYGARTSLAVGIGATVLAVVLGVAVGSTSAYFGGWYDRVASRVVDVVLSFPSLVFMISLTAVVPSAFPKVLLIVLVVGFFGFPPIARVVRAQTLSLRERGFVVASRAMGARSGHVIARQVLPNLAATITVYATISVPSMIGAEAALSFLGVGVTPPTPSWGRSIGDAVSWVRTDPMYLVFPGLALFGITLALNILGDALRDALDPRRAVFRSPRALARARRRSR